MVDPAFSEGSLIQSAPFRPGARVRALDYAVALRKLDTTPLYPPYAMARPKHTKIIHPSFFLYQFQILGKMYSLQAIAPSPYFNIRLIKPVVALYPPD